MNVHDVLAFSRLFLSVDDRHRRELQEMTGPPRDLYERVISTYTHITQPALESLLPSKDRLAADFNESKSYIYFRAIQEDQIAGFLLPVVSLRYAFNKDPIEVRIRLALAQIIDGRLVFHGFRFEAPEGGGGGQHDFYHAQLIRTFRDGIPLNPPESDLAFVPEKQPSFPLLAECPVSLALAFFISLYGITFLNELPKSGEIPEKYFKRFR